VSEANDVAEWVAKHVVQLSPSPRAPDTTVVLHARPGMADGEITALSDARRLAQVDAARQAERDRKRAARLAREAAQANNNSPQ
jgi:hypothetical protein